MADETNPDSPDPAGNEQTTSPFTGSRAGTAYLVVPDEGAGPGVLLLHSWWGLTAEMKELAERFADAGFTTLVPDLMEGERPTDAAQAAQVLSGHAGDATAGLILSSIDALRSQSRDPKAPVAVVGWSMGGSWALWAAAREPGSVSAVVSHYGVTNVDFSDLVAPVLFHSSTDDPLVGEDDVVEMQAHLLLLEKSIEVITHPNTRHFFAEAGVPMLDAGGNPGERSAAEAESAESAMERTLEFLAAHQSSSV